LDFSTSLGPTFGVHSTVCWTIDLFRDLDHQIGVQFPEFAFIDLGVDMAPGCDALMCIENLEYNG